MQRSIRARLGLSLAALSLALLASDVSARRASAPIDLAKARDARLDRPISLRLVDRPLAEALEAMSEATGVPLELAKDYEDRAVTIRVQNTPLRRVLIALGNLYRDDWKNQPVSGKRGYVLARSPARLSRQRKLIEAHGATLMDEMRRHIAAVATNGPEPWMLQAAEGDEGYAAQLKARAQVLRHLSPEALAILASGRPLRVQLAEATGPGGQALWDFARQFAMTDKAGWAPQRRASAWVQFSFDSYSIGISGLRGVPLKRLMFSFGTASGTSSRYGMVVHPDRLAQRLREIIGKLRKGEEQDPEERRRAGGGRLQNVMPPIREVPAKLGARNALLAAMADAASFDFVADSHIKPQIDVPFLKAAPTLEETLTRVCDAHASFWRVEESGLLTVRSRWWWLDDAGEPPALEREEWRRTLEEKAALSLDQAIAIANLSPEQQQRLARLLPETGSAFSAWLRFYGSLSPRQQRAARSRKGLRFWTVPESLRSQLTNLSADDPLIGNKSYEETIHHGLSMLYVVVKKNAEVQVGTGKKAYPSSITFRLKPIPDRTGRLHGGRLQIDVAIPHRPRSAKARHD